jgi:hypothetical protein
MELENMIDLEYRTALHARKSRPFASIIRTAMTPAGWKTQPILYKEGRVVDFLPVRIKTTIVGISARRGIDGR